ncbi:hypothetical protein GOODEAATRI_032033 [Goodea atripinnis]|uniref:Uncharacterized protein n=1 Tax=Goodea atripinnis TaxID=208336 RepID=A0ABV0NSB6_9TELE
MSTNHSVHYRKQHKFTDYQRSTLKIQTTNVSHKDDVVRGKRLSLNPATVYRVPCTPHETPAQSVVINENITTLHLNKNFRPKKSNGYLVKTLISESLEHRFANSFNIKLVLNNILPGLSLYESIHKFD